MILDFPGALATGDRQLGRSDHVPFHERGIPAALFIHTELEPWYHTSQDTIDKVDPDKVLDVARIVGAALFHGARKGTPALERSAARPRAHEAWLAQRPRCPLHIVPARAAAASTRLVSSGDSGTRNEV